MDSQDEDIKRYFQETSEFIDKALQVPFLQKHILANGKIKP